MNIEKIKLLDLFSGIGAFPTALKNIGANFETVAFSEIDKFAIKNYCTIHNEPESKNIGDISKVDEKKLPKFNMITFGSPCQDFSISGNQKGSVWTCSNCSFEYNPLSIHYTKRKHCPKCNATNLEKTRSSLLVEALRIIEYNKPKYLIYENVKNLTNKNFKPTFDMFLKELESYGYKVFHKILDSKDFNVPQSRKRIFVVGVLNGGQTNFEFPKGTECRVCLKDILETVVPDKYFISNLRTEKLLSSTKSIINTSPNGIIQITQPLYSQERLYNANGLSPTLLSGSSGGGMQPIKIVIRKCIQKVRVRKYAVDIEKLQKTLKQQKSKLKLTNKYIASKLNQPVTLVEHWFRTDKSFSIPNEDNWLELRGILKIRTTEFDKSILTFEMRDGVYDKANRLYCEYGLSPTLTCGDGEKIITYNNTEMSINLNDYKVRKLMPIECWKLMGFSTDDFNKVRAISSDNQLYKQSGNSIVVPIIEAILKNLLN